MLFDLGILSLGVKLLLLNSLHHHLGVNDFLLRVHVLLVEGCVLLGVGDLSFGFFKSRGDVFEVLTGLHAVSFN